MIFPASEVEKLQDGIRCLEIIVDGYGPDNLTMQSYERGAREAIAAFRALLASAVELPGAIVPSSDNWFGPWRCETCGHIYDSHSAEQSCRYCIMPHKNGDKVRLFPLERRARPVPDDKLREALRGYEREHAKQFKPLDCQCSYCKTARAALHKEGA